MTVFEYGDDIVVVDAGLAFPRDEHLGVDLVLPGLRLPARPARCARSCSRTAHEDHVGGAARTCCARSDCDEVIGDAAHARADQVEARRARAPARDRAARDRAGRRRSQIGPFTLEFVRVAHSIPDCVAVVLETRAGPGRPHRRLEARPHAGRRPEDRRRPARRARQPRRRPAARRLDERGAARHDRLGARSSARPSGSSSRCARAGS